MNLVVDTSVWSLLLRRKNHDHNHPLVQKLKSCLEQQDGIFLVGTILQEILDGVRNEEQFIKLTEYFSVFPLLEVDNQDSRIMWRLPACAIIAEARAYRLGLLSS